MSAAAIFQMAPTFKLQSSGRAYPSATLSFFETGTTDPKDVFTDAALSVPFSQPISASAAGYFPTIYLDPAETYKYTLLDQDGNLIETIDPGALPVVSATVIGSLLFPLSTAEQAAGLTIDDITRQYPYGDIRRYGADTGSSDNHVAIQAALDVSANGGPAAYVPPGNWAYTSTPTATLSSSMHGEGQASVLNANGCDGLQFGAQSSYAGSRFFRGFFIKGTGTDAKYGIRCDLPAASSSGIIYNLTFEDVTIQNFNRAVSCTGGMWNSVFRKCALYNNFIGFYFIERNIDITLDVCDVERGTITGAGSAYGVYCSVSGGITPESIKINGSLIYGYDIQVSFGQVNFCSILHTDMDNTQSIGVEIATVSGGCTVRDCWIATINASATTGVLIHDLGAPVLDRITIAQNHIICETAHAGSVGVYCGSNQKNIRVLDNDITGWETDVKGTSSSNNLLVKFNHLSATSTCVLIDSSSINNEVGPNFVESGTPLAFSSSTTPAGFSYYDTGTFTLTLTGMSATITGTVTWVANGRSIVLTIPNTGIAGTSNATTMTGTGLPAALYPVSTRQGMVLVENSGTVGVGLFTLTGGGVLTFFKDVTGAAFTNTGAKGLFDQVRYEYT